MLKYTKESLPLKYTSTHSHSCNGVSKLGPYGRFNMTDSLYGKVREAATAGPNLCDAFGIRVYLPRDTPHAQS